MQFLHIYIPARAHVYVQSESMFFSFFSIALLIFFLFLIHIIWMQMPSSASWFCKVSTDIVWADILYIICIIIIIIEMIRTEDGNAERKSVIYYLFCFCLSVVDSVRAYEMQQTNLYEAEFSTRTLYYYIDWHRGINRKKIQFIIACAVHSVIYTRILDTDII